MVDNTRHCPPLGFLGFGCEQGVRRIALIVLNVNEFGSSSYCFCSPTSHLT